MQDKLIEEIKQIPVIAKHLHKTGKYIGNNVYIAPICVWSHDIEVMVDISRNVFKKALDKFVGEHEDVKRAYFVNNHEEIPFIRFEIGE